MATQNEEVSLKQDRESNGEGTPVTTEHRAASESLAPTDEKDSEPSMFTWGTANEHPMSAGDRVHPMSTGDGANEHPTSTGDRLKEHPRSTWDGANEHSTSAGDRVKEHPMSTGDGVNEHPTSTGDRLKEHPMSTWDGANEHPTSAGDRVKEHPMSTGDGANEHPMSTGDGGMDSEFLAATNGGQTVAEWAEAMETEKMELNPEAVPNEMLVNEGPFVHQQRDQMTVGVASLATEH